MSVQSPPWTAAGENRDRGAGSVNPSFPSSPNAYVWNFHHEGHAFGLERIIFRFPIKIEYMVHRDQYNYLPTTIVR